MQLGKDQSPETSSCSVDENDDEATKWLLDMDLSEPVEQLFTVTDDAAFDDSLTELEAEMAGRPMFRGHGQGDDISAMLGESIVAVDVGGDSDIYAASNSAEQSLVEQNTPMAIDHSQSQQETCSVTDVSLEDGADILSLSDMDDMGEKHLVLVKAGPGPETKAEPVPELELEQTATVEPPAPIEQANEVIAKTESKIVTETETETEFKFDPDFEADFDEMADIGPEVEIETYLGIGSELEPESELGFDFDSLGELDLENTSEDYPESECKVDEQAENVAAYVANTPAPVDDEAFDLFLLEGEQLSDADAEADASGLVVERTEGVTSVDPVLNSGIDYHEDFELIEGFNDDSAGAITGVISQVMEELTASVAQRLADFSIASDSVEVEAMLGNNVDSIISCVSDGYAPIVEIRPQLSAALRQLGQTEVDAIYVRITHRERGETWNDLFKDDFVPGGSSDEEALSVAPEEAVAQPFATLNIDDEFDFAGLEPDPVDGFLVDGFDDDIAPYSTSPGDDPLSSITFAAVDDAESELEFEASLKTFDVEEQLPNNDSSRGDADESAQESADADLSWCIPADIDFSSTGAKGEIFADFLDVFIDEAAAEIEKLEEAVEEWERGSVAGEAHIPPRVSHTLHTLKGIAKGVGLQCYGTLIHNYETLLDALPAPDENDKATYFRIISTWLDTVVRGFEHIERARSDVESELPVRGATPAPEVVEEPVAESGELQQQQEESQSKVDSQDSIAATTRLADAPAATHIPERMDDKQLADEGAKTLAGQQSIRMSAEALDKLLNLTNQAQQLGVRSSESTVRGKLAAAESLARLSSVRAHITKIADRALSNVAAKGQSSGSELDALEMDQYSELQEAANILRESVEDLGDLINLSTRQLSLAEALMKQQAAVISSLGSSIQAARVIPVSRLIPGLRRIVRTVGTDLGKTVSLKVLNQVGTLDRDNHARCQVILEHMVRNAMDHGIEAPEQRLNAGKPASGTISIDVHKEGADYIITLSDDGRGVDPAIMKETAYQKGLDVDVDALSDEEATRLIFHKGFSTAESVSEISGRGVGMDIVLSELQQIGGDIKIESTVGEGTSFHIRIPPNVSVNGALLVSAGEHSYAIPLDGLIAVDYVDVDSFFDAIEQKSKLSLFGVECEPAYLATICHGENLPERSVWSRSVPVMIAGSEDRYMAIAVDDVKQALELVIRSLGTQFAAVPGVAGATTTSDGQAVVAMDLNSLVNSVASEQYSPVSLAQEAAERLLVLVVDDSRTQRMVSTNQFDTLGVETITAENGMVAIDLLNTTHRLPDVILLDVEMPVKDGIQTLREIRKSVRYSHIPVIMVTSRTGAKHRALADEAGCNGYMGKPFNFPVLVEKISQLTGHDLQLT